MAELQLLIRIISRTGEERLIEVAPGGSTQVNPGDQIFLIGRQAPEAQLSQDGNDLKITMGGEDVFLLEDYFEHVPEGMDGLVLVTDATEVATYVAAAADAAANAQAPPESLVQLGQASPTDLSGDGIQSFWASDPDITVSEGGWSPFAGLGGPEANLFIFDAPIAPPAPGPAPAPSPAPSPTPGFSSSSSTPEPEIPDLPPHIPIEELTDGENGIVFEGGWVVSWLGDINGDGIDDIIIGSPNYGRDYWYGRGSDSYSDYYKNNDDNAFRYPTGYGRAYVVFGDPEMDIGGLNPVDLETALDGANGFIIDYTRMVNGKEGGLFKKSEGADWDEPGVYGEPGALGFDVADAGDVNGDGINDFIVTAPGIGWGGPASVFVVFGNDAGSAPWSGGFLDLDEIIGQNAEAPAEFGFQILPGCYCGEDTFGMSAHGVGDINGDGIDDFIIGSPSYGHFYDAGSHQYYDGGEVYVVFGREDWFSHYDPSCDSEGGPHPLPDLNGLRIVHGGWMPQSVLAGTLENGNGGPEPDITDIHNLGFDVSGFGDFNGDGIGDMIIGAPSDVTWGRYGGNNGGGPFGPEYEDATYVVYGGGEFDWNGETVLDLARLITDPADGGYAGGFIIHGVNDYSPRSFSFNLYLNDEVNTWYDQDSLYGVEESGPEPFWYPGFPGKYPDAGPATLDWYTNGQYGPEGVDAYLEWLAEGHLETEGHTGYDDYSNITPFDYRSYYTYSNFDIFGDLDTSGVVDISYGPESLDAFIQWYIDGGLSADFYSYYNLYSTTGLPGYNRSESEGGDEGTNFIAWLHSQGIGQVGEDTQGYIPEGYDGFGSENVPQGWEAMLMGYFSYDNGGYNSNSYSSNYPFSTSYYDNHSWHNYLEGGIDGQTEGSFLPGEDGDLFQYLGWLEAQGWLEWGNSEYSYWNNSSGSGNSSSSYDDDCDSEWNLLLEGGIKGFPWTLEQAGAWESAGKLAAQGEVIIEYHEEMRTQDSGWSVSFTGDINGDGFDDVIVGAPDASAHEAKVVYADVMAQFSAYLHYQNLTELPEQVQVELFGEVLPSGGFMPDMGAFMGDMPDMEQFLLALEDMAEEGMFPEVDPQLVDAAALAEAYGITGFELKGPDEIDLGDSDLAVQFDAWFQANYVDAYMNEYHDGAAYVVFGGPDVGEIWLDQLDGDNGFVIANARGWSQQENGGIAAGYEAAITGVHPAVDGEHSGGVELLAPEEGGEPLNIWTELFLDYNPELDGENLTFWNLGEGDADGENLGWSVSGGGDVNGDGIADLIVGAPEAHDGDDSYHLGAGGTFVIFGVDTTAPDYDPQANAWSDGVFALSEIDGANGFELVGIDPSDNSGASVALGTDSNGDPAGDFNDDGFSDILIGAPLAGYEDEDPEEEPEGEPDGKPLDPGDLFDEKEEGPLPDGTETGEAYLILGGSNGLGGAGGLDPESIEPFEYPDVDPLDPLLYEEAPPDMP